MIPNKFIYDPEETEAHVSTFHVIDVGGSETYCGIPKTDIYPRKIVAKAEHVHPRGVVLHCPECQAVNRAKHMNLKGWDK